MPWWFWTFAGVPLGVWFWRITFRSFWEDEKYKDGEMLAICLMISTVSFAVVGPGRLLLTLLARLRGQEATDWEWIGRTLGGESRASKAKRKEQELRDREKRIRDAERELGIT